MHVLIAVLCLFFVKTHLTEDDFFGKTKKNIESFAKALSEDNFSNLLSPSINSLRFLLYTNNSNEPLELTEKNNNCAIAEINLNFDSFFIIHGWLGNGRLRWIKELAKRLHKVGQFNVIAVDWSILALTDYFGAIRRISAVGYRIKDFLKSKNIPTNTTQIIGHSLGGQVASFVAKGLGQNKLRQIVGLDPAGPLFDWPVILPQQYRLSPDDATTVQVIHTSKFVRGITITCGTIDFYVNGGANQPGCTPINTATCSHQMAHAYYILTVTEGHKYPGIKYCPFDGFGCSSDTAYMGFEFNGNKTGIYSVTTNATEVNPSD